MFERGLLLSALGGRCIALAMLGLGLMGAAPLGPPIPRERPVQDGGIGAATSGPIGIGLPLGGGIVDTTAPPEPTALAAPAQPAPQLGLPATPPAPAFQLPPALPRPSIETPPAAPGLGLAAQDRFAEAAEEYSGILMIQTAIGAVGLLLLGIGLLTVHRAAREAGRSADLVRRVLTTLERPHIFPKVTGFDVPTAGADFPIGSQIRYAYVNRGRTPAILLEATDNVQSVPKGTLPVPIDPDKNAADTQFPRGYVIAENENFGFVTNPATHVSQVGLAALTGWSPPNDAFLLGCLRYEDLFGNRHIVAFCAQYVAETGKFMLFGDERYNYTRMERPAKAGAARTKPAEPHAAATKRTAAKKREPERAGARGRDMRRASA